MNFNEILNQIQHPEEVTDQFAPEDIQTNQVSGILASFPVLFWVPLLIAGDSPYAKFCANQGLIYFVTNLVLGAVGGFLGWFPLIGWLIRLLASLISLACFVLLLVSACQRKARKIPVLGNLFQAFN